MELIGFFIVGEELGLPAFVPAPGRGKRESGLIFDQRSGAIWDFSPVASRLSLEATFFGDAGVLHLSLCEGRGEGNPGCGGHNTGSAFSPESGNRHLDAPPESP